MQAATLLRLARTGSGLSLRVLAQRAGTSHSTLSAYEAGHVDPSVGTMQRIVRAAGYDLQADLTPLVGGEHRGEELVEALELAALFPARHAPVLTFPKFGAR